MSDYKLVEVLNRSDLKRFVKFPDELYRDCPQYVPALHIDQVKSLTRISSLKYCMRKMWMVMDGKKVLGRICAMVNPRYNEKYNTRRARFGWFDCINDIEVARLLLDTAEAWAREQGMNEIHGPLYYNTLGKQGMLTEGFDNIPPFNCLYNYPYYNDLVTALGYEKECDWVQYKMPAGQELPDKVERISALLKKKYRLHEGNISRLKRDEKMVKHFFDVYNESFSDSVYNFIPFTDEEMKEEAKAAIHLLNDKTSIIILDGNNELVAFGIAFPTISPALQKAKGRLFPFGWFHLFRAIRNLDTVDLMINGAVPEWQNSGVSAVYHGAMARRCKKYGIKWAISNPQIEGAVAANVWSSYENELFMRRRCYVKSI